MIDVLKNKKKPNFPRKLPKVPIGVYGDGGIIYLFFKDGKDRIFAEKSTNGHKFKKFKENIKIRISGVEFSPAHISHINISRMFDNYLLAIKTDIKGKSQVFAASGRDFELFNIASDIPDLSGEAIFVPNYQSSGRSFLLGAGEGIKGYWGKNLIEWQEEKVSILETHTDFFGESPLVPGNAFVTEEGILFFYFILKGKNGLDHFELKAVLLDKNDPTKIVKKVGNHLWETPDDWGNKKIKMLGLVKKGNDYLSFWDTLDGIYSVVHPAALLKDHAKHFPHISLNKLKHNPLIRPIVENIWESKATFNPAAIYEKDKVHIIYRAIGDDDVSVLGYASSSDGLNIDQRLPDPIYIPTQPFESSGPYKGTQPGEFTSGGGCWGGCEDPRITKVDDKIYMTYVAYNGWSHPRVAITSIDVNDFNDKKWNWSKPVLISRPNVVDKNACVLPEKIDGKFVIFHRVFPNILVDFVDNLDFDGETFLKDEFVIKPRERSWDSRKIGAGPPPIKTPEGWLLIYQAVGERDPGRYKIGAMLLDLKDPTRVIARSNDPILAPDQWYENEGHKAGVAYPCGAVNFDNNLVIYYGGADTVVCAAHAPTDEFIHNLKKHKEQKLFPSLIPN